jgi:hypothetical protein
MTATTTKRTNDIVSVKHYRNGVLVDTEAAPAAGGGVETFTESTPFADTTTFYSTVDDGTSVVQSNTVTYSYVYPYYYGEEVPGSSDLSLLTKYIVGSTASMTRSFTTLDGEVYYFLYPASYGALTSILDANGWAVNTRARINVPFGASLTGLAILPAGASRSLIDPFAEKKRPWKTWVVLGGAVIVVAALWYRGVFAGLLG